MLRSSAWARYCSPNNAAAVHQETPRAFVLRANAAQIFLLPESEELGVSCLIEPGSSLLLVPRDALSALYRQLHRIQTDMGYKANSLVLDNKCMDSRRKLVVPAEKFVPEVDTFNRTTNRPLSPLKNGQLELA